MGDQEEGKPQAAPEDKEHSLISPPRLSTSVSSHRNASDLIPMEVIESWLKGEYLVGVTQSTDYQYIGWSLLLRGFYEYRNHVKGKMTHWGYCYIDLKDGDLFYAGVRINSSEQWEFEKYNHPIYWHSVFSKFVGLESEAYPRLYFGYIAHLLEYVPEGASGGRSYHGQRQREGERSQGFFEWYFNSPQGKRNLSQAEEQRLKNIDQFWQEACRAMNQDTLPTTSNDDGIEYFKSTVLPYLADRDRFDSDLALLEQLHPNQEILALVNLDLRTIEGGSLKATLQPLSREIDTGHFEFRRLEQPYLD